MPSNTSMSDSTTSSSFGEPTHATSGWGAMQLCGMSVEVSDGVSSWTSNCIESLVSDDSSLHHINRNHLEHAFKEAD